jgi:hypothetical protein
MNSMPEGNTSLDEKKSRFQYKLGNREVEEELTPEEIGERLQDLFDLQQSERPFYSELKRLRCFSVIAGSDAFQEFLARQSAPEPPPPTPQIDLAELEEELVRQFREGAPKSAERLLLFRRIYRRR